MGKADVQPDTAQAGAGPERYFRTDHLSPDLKGRSVRGGACTVSAQAFRFLLQVGATVALARLVTPEEYGLLAAVTALTGFLSLFNGVGLSVATVQRAGITHAQVSTLFWVNAAVGLILALLAAAAGQALGWHLRDPRLAGIALALAGEFILIGVGAQHRALLRRQMRFGALARIEILSMVAGIVAGIAAAACEAGYWALVLMQLTMALVSAIGPWMACGWRPGPPVAASGIGSMLEFGRHLTGLAMLHYFSRRFDNLIVGTYCGAAQLGLYDRAYQLMVLPFEQLNRPVAGVVLPILSRLQEDAERFRSYFLKGILLTSLLGMPLVAFLFVTAGELIPCVFGAQWMPAVPLFRALAPAAFLDTVTVGVGWLAVSQGQTGRHLRWTLAVCAITVAGFFLGIRCGAVGVALAFSLCRTASAVPTLIYTCAGTPVRWTAILRTVCRPAFASIAAAVALAFAGRCFPGLGHPAVDLVRDGCLYAALYLTVWMLLPGGKPTLLEMVKLVTFLGGAEEQAGAAGASR
jgi:O-antigen/teichoic acid export membrane protein